jgi:hypothetical protein
MEPHGVFDHVSHRDLYGVRYLPAVGSCGHVDRRLYSNARHCRTFDLLVSYEDQSSPDRTLRELLVLIVIWIALSFSFDAITYVLVAPALSHASAHWTFFVDQSPWIWLSYTVLIISGYAGRWLYLRRQSLQSA